MKLKYLIEDLLWHLPRRARKTIIGDSILIKATVIIRNGNRVIIGHNRIVSLGIKSLLQTLISLQTATSQTALSSQFVANATYSRIRVGQDTTTVTTEGMTALSSEITTDRNSAATKIEKVLAGQYRIKWVATWNAGTITGTCGELGLYLTGMQAYADGALPVDNGFFIINYASPQLFSRLSSASGDFVSFTINTAVPLSIEWRLDITF